MASSDLPAGAARPFEGTWPAEDLEPVEKCPVCQGIDRQLVHDELRDWSFGSAPGAWTLFRCSDCRSGYLDPRPSSDSLGRAYEAYYTHESVEPPRPTNVIERLRAALGNGYRNRRFGTMFEPSYPVGFWLATILPFFRRPIDLAYRFLPRSRGSGRLLDVGSGSGEWLKMAESAGWTVAGVEPDANALQFLDSRIEIRQTLADWSTNGAQFAVISLNHVIEHVENPTEILQLCWELLESGGQLFIDTPNLDAWGHQEHGRYWRGLEVPRHLVLFTRQSLRRLLGECGFVEIRDRIRLTPYPFIEDESIRMERLACGTTSRTRSPRRQRLARQAQKRLNHAEFITVTALKP